MAAHRIELLDRSLRLRLTDFLQKQGIRQATIGWKYFDDDFNQRRNRGFVALEGNHVCGFLGTIPFDVCTSDDVWPSDWTCDWFVEDPLRRGAVGLGLYAEAMAYNPHLSHVGGTAATRAILGTLTDHSFPGSGVAYRLPLRAGDYLRRFLRKSGLPSGLYFEPLARVPLVKCPTLPRRLPVVLTSNVDRALEALFEIDLPTTGPAPFYDYAYVTWQIGRCPTLESFTCYVPASPVPAAGAVCWRARYNSETWRIALWNVPDADDALDAVLQTSVREAYRQGGTSISAIVSHHDERLRGALVRGGFRPHYERTLDILAEKPPEPAHDYLRSSWLDSDEASLIA